MDGGIVEKSKQKENKNSGYAEVTLRDKSKFNLIRVGGEKIENNTGFYYIKSGRYEFNLTKKYHALKNITEIKLGSRKAKRWPKTAFLPRDRRDIWCTTNRFVLRQAIISMLDVKYRRTMGTKRADNDVLCDNTYSVSTTKFIYPVFYVKLIGDSNYHVGPFVVNGIMVESRAHRDVLFDTVNDLVKDSGNFARKLSVSSVQKNKKSLQFGLYSEYATRRLDELIDGLLEFIPNIYALIDFMDCNVVGFAYGINKKNIDKKAEFYFDIDSNIFDSEINKSMGYNVYLWRRVDKNLHNKNLSMFDLVYGINSAVNYSKNYTVENTISYRDYMFMWWLVVTGDPYFAYKKTLEACDRSKVPEDFSIWYRGLDKQTKLQKYLRYILKSPDHRALMQDFIELIYGSFGMTKKEIMESLKKSVVFMQDATERVLSSYNNKQIPPEMLEAISNLSDRIIKAHELLLSASVDTDEHLDVIGSREHKAIAEPTRRVFTFMEQNTVNGDQNQNTINKQDKPKMEVA